MNAAYLLIVMLLCQTIVRIHLISGIGQCCSPSPPSRSARRIRTLPGSNWSEELGITELIPIDQICLAHQCFAFGQFAVDALLELFVERPMLQPL